MTFMTFEHERQILLFWSPRPWGEFFVSLFITYGGAMVSLIAVSLKCIFFSRLFIVMEIDSLLDFLTAE